MRYLLRNTEGEEVINNLDKVCLECLERCNSLSYINNECKVDNEPKRNGKLKTYKGDGFFCCGDSKTSDLFRKKIENLVYAIPDFEKIKNNISETTYELEKNRFNRLVHNIKSLNGHSIQELYSLIPQNILTENIENQIEIISEYIKKDMKRASMTFIRIAKHNSQIKTEFSIHDKLISKTPHFEKRFHNIKQVLLNVSHTFFNDFKNIDVKVKFGECNTKLLADYESLHVAFYHLLDNAVKYIKPKSILNITFVNEYNVLTVSFDMESIVIEDEETERIFDENYSGINAVYAKKSGEGLGMYLIKKLVELNNGTFQVYRGNKITNLNKIKFTNNKFNLDFRL